MAKGEVIDHYSPDPNILERRASRYIARLDSLEETSYRERRPEEVEALRRITRRAVIIAAVSGIVSGGIIGGAEIWMRFGVFDGMENMSWTEQLPYWGAFFVFTGVISAIEILFLYIIALRALGKIAELSGLALHNRGGYPKLFSRALGRAAMEFPNPRTKLFGIDPYAYIPRWRLLFFNLLYKVKVGATSFILRIFIRRVLARVAVRSIIPLLAAPLYAAWNAIIIWKVIHEGRLRTLGPFAIENELHELFHEGDPPEKKAQEWFLRGTAEMMMRGHDAHPNYVYMLARLREEMESSEETIIADWNEAHEDLESLGDEAREQFLNVLTLAAILGTRLHRLQRKLLREVCRRYGCEFREDKLKPLHRRLREGRRIKTEDLAEVWK